MYFCDGAKSCSHTWTLTLPADSPIIPGIGTAARDLEYPLGSDSTYWEIGYHHQSYVYLNYTSDSAYAPPPAATEPSTDGEGTHGEETSREKASDVAKEGANENAAFNRVRDEVRSLRCRLAPGEKASCPIPRPAR